MPRLTTEEIENFNNTLENICGCLDGLGIHLQLCAEFDGRFIKEVDRDDIESVRDSAKDLEDCCENILSGLDDDEDRRDARLADKSQKSD